MVQENKDKDYKGCAIAVVLIVLMIIIIVLYFLTTSKADIANTGVSLLFIAFMAGAYFSIKAFLKYTSDTENKIVRIVVPIAIFVSFMALFGAIMNNFQTMLVIGSIAPLVGIGLWLYFSNKE